LRDIVDEAFRRRAILEMEPRILAIADELADGLFAQGIPADLVERYARQLPLDSRPRPKNRRAKAPTLSRGN
jgi:cytochrome P450 PksS